MRETTMSRNGSMGRTLISDMMHLLLAGPLRLRTRLPDRGYPNDALESDDPSADFGGLSLIYVDGFTWCSSGARPLRDTAPHARPQVNLTGESQAVSARLCPDHAIKMGIRC